MVSVKRYIIGDDRKISRKRHWFARIIAAYLIVYMVVMAKPEGAPELVGGLLATIIVYSLAMLFLSSPKDGANEQSAA